MLIATVVGGLIVQQLLPVTKLETLTLSNLLEQARHAGTAADSTGRFLAWTWPNEHTSHNWEYKFPATMLATGTWIFGIGLATFIYGLGYLSAEDVRRQFAPLHSLFVNKWWFDELYDFIFVRPVLIISQFISGIDRNWIDGLIHAISGATIWIAKRWDFVADGIIVDGTINLLARWCYSLGLSLRTVQTGRLRQYVMFIVIGAIAIFVLISFFWTPTLAG